jgi:hypothetical protein
MSDDYDSGAFDDDLNDIDLPAAAAAPATTAIGSLSMRPAITIPPLSLPTVSMDDSLADDLGIGHGGVLKGHKSINHSHLDDQQSQHSHSNDLVLGGEWIAQLRSYNEMAESKAAAVAAASGNGGKSAVNAEREVLRELRRLYRQRQRTNSSNTNTSTSSTSSSEKKDENLTIPRFYIQVSHLLPSCCIIIDD